MPRRLPASVSRAKQAVRAPGLSNAERAVFLGKIPRKFRSEREQRDFVYFKRVVQPSAIRDVKAPIEWTAFRVREVKAQARKHGKPVPTEKIGFIRAIVPNWSRDQVEYRRRERAEQYRFHIEEGGTADTFEYKPQYAGRAA